MKISLAKEVIENYTIIIDNLKTFNSSEINELNDNLKIIYLLNEIQCYFSIVERNFDEFEKQLKEDSTNLLQFSKSPLRPNEQLLNRILININRLTLNYLRSYRMLIDHIPRLLNSDQRQNYITFKSEIFDNNFEFRFCDQLRNFAQHKNLPVTDFSCEADISIAKVFYFINIDNLLSQDYHWRAETKSDMKNYNKIDSLSIISSHYKLITKIRKFIFNFYKDEFLSASNYFKNLENNFSGNYKLVLLHNEKDVENLPLIMIEELQKDFC